LIGMIAEKYVMRAPSRYSGTDGPGTLVNTQFAIGARRPDPSRVRPSSLPVIASVAAGACVPMSVSSRALSARWMSLEDAVCDLMNASRFNGSVMFIPSITRSHCTSGRLPGAASGFGT